MLKTVDPVDTQEGRLEEVFPSGTSCRICYINSNYVGCPNSHETTLTSFILSGDGRLVWCGYSVGLSDKRPGHQVRRFDESNVLFKSKQGDRHSQPSRWGGRTSSSQCGRHCCRSKIPSEDTLLSPTQTAGHRSWSAHIRPSCPQQADGHKDTYTKTIETLSRTAFWKLWVVFQQKKSL